MYTTGDLLAAFEDHSVQRIQDALRTGVSATEPIRGKKPIEWLIEMYTRSPQFPDCLRVLMHAGAVIEDPLLEAVLLDDDERLRALHDFGHSLDRRLDLNCAFTSLHGVSALHVCAEYNSLRCAAVLLAAGIDVNVCAGHDADGLGGHTPIFHAVNARRNHSRPVMELLVDAGADLNVRLKGLVWGGGFEWETVVFDVTPISYAQCGLYFQFHRNEELTYDNIGYLYKKRYGADAPIRNVPNKYLIDDRVFPPRI